MKKQNLERGSSRRHLITTFTNNYMQENYTIVPFEAVSLFEWVHINIIDAPQVRRPIEELSLPDERCWVNWRLEERDGKQTKVPYRPDGRKASSTNPQDWSSYAEVSAVQESFSGIGIVLTGSLLGIDIDHCVVGGEVSSEVAALVEKAGTYTEISPSRTGLHLYIRLTEPMELERNRYGNYECYTSGRYLTVTGTPWRESGTVRTMTPEEALDVLRIMGYPWGNQSSETKADAVGIISLTDEELLKKMFSAKNGAKVKALYEGDAQALVHGDDSVADAALCTHLAFWTGKDAGRIESLWLSSPLGARPKTQERKDYRDRTIAFAIEHCEGWYQEEFGLMESDPSQPSQSTQLVELVLSNHQVRLFLDQYQTAHVCFPRGRHTEVWPCDSSEFRYWLCDEYYKETDGKAPGTNALSGALNVLEGRARAGAMRYTLHNRIAERDGAIWYDLCDAEWRAIRIDENGWEVVSNPPIMFRRYSYHQPQADPIEGGDIRDVFQFINVKEHDQQILFLAGLVSFFIPEVPHPLLYVHGQQGSAKSSLLETVHELVDPSAVGSLSMPRNLEDLKLLLDHHSAFASFDNVSYIQADTADLLCRAVTGMGFERRKLYTNSETVLCYIQANIAINGINLGSSRPDLLQRSILLELTPVEKSERRQDRELRTAFLKAKPALFGAILNTVVKVVKIMPSIQPQGLYRMADFTVIGCAVAEVLGLEQEAFLTAYSRNEEEQTHSVLESSIEASLIQELMTDKERWEGSATVLLVELTMLNKGRISEEMLPKNAAALSRRLRVLRPALEATGLHLSTDRSTERTICIRKISKNPVESVEGVHTSSLWP